MSVLHNVLYGCKGWFGDFEKLQPYKSDYALRHLSEHLSDVPKTPSKMSVWVHRVVSGHTHWDPKAVSLFGAGRAHIPGRSPSHPYRRIIA
eukprot:1353577-Prymnesium_polylepis.1